MINTLAQMNGATQVHVPDQIVSFIRWFLNQYDFVGTLMLLMLVDFITGMIAAFIQKKISSTTSYIGMCRKSVVILAVGMGVILEPYSNGLPLGRMIATCFMITECISIIENMDKAGIPIPKPLIDVVNNMKRDANMNTGDSALPSVSINHATNVDIHSEKAKPGASDSTIIRTVEVPANPADIVGTPSSS